MAVALTVIIIICYPSHQRCGHRLRHRNRNCKSPSVSQDRNDAVKNNRWIVEFGTESHDDNITIIRLKSCSNKYLTASNQPFLFGMTGRKVFQTAPRRLDSSVELEPIRQGNQVKLRTRYGQFMRANGGLRPWRNSVTHDFTHAFQEWIVWDVDVVDIVVQSPAARPAPPLVVHSDSFTSSDSSSPSTNWSNSPAFNIHEEACLAVKGTTATSWWEEVLCIQQLRIGV